MPAPVLRTGPENKAYSASMAVHSRGFFWFCFYRVGAWEMTDFFKKSVMCCYYIHFLFLPCE